MADSVNTNITPVVNKEVIYKLRQDISDLKAKLEAHFGASGSVHEIGTKEYSGFMSPELYNKLLGLQSQLNRARETIIANDVPDNLMLFWYGDANKLPAGYTLCNGSNDTYNFAGKYIKPCISDTASGTTGGTDKFSTIPLPRHRHKFNNYIFSEVWSELAGSVGQGVGVKRKSVGNLLGSGAGGSTTQYPLYYQDTTKYVGTQSTPSISVTPPYVALHVIRRDTEPTIYTPDGVGTIKINIGKTIPAGWLELNGDWVDAGYYKAIYRYAASNNLVASESTYTTTINETGACGYFAYRQDTNLLRLPTMKGIVKLRGIDAKNESAAQEKGHHYHGMGPMWDNNGKWGRLSYSTSEYAPNAKGWFWNGRGGHDTYEDPPNDGAIITSHEISVGSTGNGEVCDSLNVNLIIRAFHEEAATTSYASTEVMNLGFEDDLSVVTEVDDMASTVLATYDSISYDNPEITGWRIEPGGRLHVWGEQNVSCRGTSKVVFPVTFMDKVFSLNVTNVDDENTNVRVTVVDKSGFEVSLDLKDEKFLNMETVKVRFSASGV